MNKEVFLPVFIIMFSFKSKRMDQISLAAMNAINDARNQVIKVVAAIREAEANVSESVSYTKISAATKVWQQVEELAQETEKSTCIAIECIRSMKQASWSTVIFHTTSYENILEQWQIIQFLEQDLRLEVRAVAYNPYRNTETMRHAIMSAEKLETGMGKVYEDTVTKIFPMDIAKLNIPSTQTE
jgi:hypothetical protein